MSKKAGQRRYGRFALAAAIYVAGVVAFTSWSHFMHRAALLGHIDETLECAAHAAREIVGDNYAESLLLIGNTNAFAYKACQQQLGRFAKSGGFTAIGAASHTASEAHSLIVGSGDPEAIPVGEVKLGEPLAECVANAVLDLAAAPDRHNMSLLTTDHPKYGRMRMALLYKSRPAGDGIVFIATEKVESMNGLLRNQAVQETAAGLFLLVMAVPLVVLYNRSHQRAAEELAELNARLQQEIEGQKTREEELKDAIHDLERFNAVSSGREDRIIELKAEVNELLKEMNRQPRYNTDKAD
jgi:hypothetical protein